MAKGNENERKPRRHITPKPDAYDFWTHKTVEELAREQGVQSKPAIARLGGWPDDIDDGFGEALAQMREF